MGSAGQALRRARSFLQPVSSCLCGSVQLICLNRHEAQMQTLAFDKSVSKLSREIGMRPRCEPMHSIRVFQSCVVNTPGFTGVSFACLPLATIGRIEYRLVQQASPD